MDLFRIYVSKIFTRLTNAFVYNFKILAYILRFRLFTFAKAFSTILILDVFVARNVKDMY